MGGWPCPGHRWENQGCGDPAACPRPDSRCGAEAGFGPENPESRGHMLPCPEDWALATSLPPVPARSTPHSQVPDLAAESLLVFVSPRNVNKGTPWGEQHPDAAPTTRRQPSVPWAWASAQGTAWVGTSPCRYLLGLLLRPISARLCLSAPLPCLLSPEPSAHTGGHRAWRWRAGRTPGRPTTQLSLAHRAGSDFLGTPCRLPSPLTL